MHVTAVVFGLLMGASWRSSLRSSLDVSVVQMQQDEEPEELILARAKLDSTSISQQENTSIPGKCSMPTMAMSLAALACMQWYLGSLAYICRDQCNQISKFKALVVVMLVHTCR